MRDQSEGMTGMIPDHHRLDLAARLAYALLRQQGALSLEDIEALPIVYGRHEALAVANRLLRSDVGDVEESSAARAGSLNRRDHLLCLKSELSRARV